MEGTEETSALGILKFLLLKLITPYANTADYTFSDKVFECGRSKPNVFRPILFT